MQIQTSQTALAQSHPRFVYQLFEHKHKIASLDTIIAAELMDNSFSTNLQITASAMKNFYHRLYKKQSIFKNSVIAIDSENSDNILGSVIGIDLVEMFDYIAINYDTEDKNIQRYLDVLNIAMDPVFSSYRAGDKKLGKTILLENITIKPEYQNLKIGKQLFENFFEIAKENNYDNVVLFYTNPIMSNIVKKYEGIQTTTTLDDLHRINPEVGRLIQCEINYVIFPLKQENPQ